MRAPGLDQLALATARRKPSPGTMSSIPCVPIVIPRRLSSRTLSASRLPSDRSDRDHEERPDEVRLEQRRQAELDVRCVPVVEADPHVGPLPDNVQDPVEPSTPIQYRCSPGSSLRRGFPSRGSRSRGRPSPSSERSSAVRGVGNAGEDGRLDRRRRSSHHELGSPVGKPRPRRTSTPPALRPDDDRRLGVN